MYDPERHGRGTCCLRCGAVNRRPWRNPLLVLLKQRGTWKHTVFGGMIVCKACAQLYEDQRRGVEMRLLFDACGIPPEFHGATWDTYSDRDHGLRAQLGYMQGWLSKREDRWIYLTGGVGTGKTRAACTLAGQWLAERSRSVMFLRSHAFLTRIRDVENERRGEDSFSLPRLGRCELLVLDDLGSEKATDFTRSRLLDLLERRHNRQLAMIVTSNFTLDDLSDRLDDDRIPSRLGQWCDVVKLSVSDYRVIDAKQRKGKK